jgi:hypothetical protein
MHPSGLTLARWNWPFKTAAEREHIARWRARFILDDSIPF